jgi:ribonuclease T1
MASFLKRLSGWLLDRHSLHSGARQRGVSLWVSVVAVVFGLTLWFGAGTVDARKRSEDIVSVVALGELPPQAQSTYRLILSGGPFRYRHKDGTVFGNRERLLPRMARGYYREYTVETPGSDDRGARRIVCGGHQPTTPDACYYTQDHYASFRRIAP